jgi:hypothetical protein
MEPGDRATLTFTGTGVKYITYRDEWSGIANVQVDGTTVATVDLYRTPFQAQAVMHTVTGLAPGAHTLSVVVTGTRNPASGGSWVFVDAFDVTP